MTNYIQEGKTLTVAAPSGGVESGELVVVNALIGVAAFDAAEGDDVELQVEGVFTLPKVSANTITVGERLYWNGTALTDTPGTDSKPLVGVAAAAAGNGETTVACRLMLTGAIGPSA